ncbi:MAG TPA: hypothetical protein VLL82_15075 [Mycobacterium sp.]|nr:hypothetical protein [Mycobacterium sp.]
MARSVFGHGALHAVITLIAPPAPIEVLAGTGALMAVAWPPPYALIQWTRREYGYGGDTHDASWTFWPTHQAALAAAEPLIETGTDHTIVDIRVTAPKRRPLINDTMIREMRRVEADATQLGLAARDGHPDREVGSAASPGLAVAKVRKQPKLKSESK